MYFWIRGLLDVALDRPSSPRRQGRQSSPEPLRLWRAWRGLLGGSRLGGELLAARLDVGDRLHVAPAPPTLTWIWGSSPPMNGAPAESEARRSRSAWRTSPTPPAWARKEHCASTVSIFIRLERVVDERQVVVEALLVGGDLRVALDLGSTIPPSSPRVRATGVSFCAAHARSGLDLRCVRLGAGRADLRPVIVVAEILARLACVRALSTTCRARASRRPRGCRRCAGARARRWGRERGSERPARAPRPPPPVRHAPAPADPSRSVTS